MRMQLEAGFTRQVRRQIEGYQFKVGVLEDRAHYWPSFGPMSNLAKKTPPKLGKLAGGPVRQIYKGSYKGQRYSNESTADVLVQNMERTGINFLQEPFKKKSSEIMRFSREFLRMAIAKRSPNRVVNLLQAIVRNPIALGEYGSNSTWRKKIKGFDRHLMDTGQMFKAIKAKVIKRNV